jgi:trimeric autotransporter adhesin
VLQITKSTNGTAGVFDVFLSNDANFVYSTPLTIVIEPYIDSLSVPDSVNPGDGVRMEVVATSTSALSYQWYRSAVASGTGAAIKDVADTISGGTSSVLVLTAAQLSDDAFYRVAVSSKDAVNLSDWKKMTVVTKVQIPNEGQPQGLTQLQGTSASLSVTATGGGTLKYRWLLDGNVVSNGATVSGATSATLTLGSLALNQFRSLRSSRSRWQHQVV